jgi:hypothetical protein
MIKVKIILIFTAVLFCSCEYTYREKYIIRNNSSETILIMYKLNYGSNADTLLSLNIEPNKEEQLYTTTGVRGKKETPPQHYEQFIPFFSMLDIYKDSVKVQKDFLNMKEWDYNLIDKSNVTYLLKVSEDNSINK